MTGRRRLAAAIVALALAAIALPALAASHAPAPSRRAHAAMPDPEPPRPEAVPVPVAPALAPAGAPAAGRTVDGIGSAPLEQLALHVHVHLTVFDEGAQRQIPYGIGIAPPLQVQMTAHGPFVAGGARFAWLHTHAADGIIHAESPVRRSYTLGDFFAVWGQPLDRHHVGPLHGSVTSFLDGRRYHGSPRDVPLRAHAQIQLDIGRPDVAPASIRFPPGL
jgi:hypothetical protein